MFESELIKNYMPWPNHDVSRFSILYDPQKIRELNLSGGLLLSCTLSSSDQSGTDNSK